MSVSHAVKSIDSTQVVGKRKFNRQTEKSITEGGNNYFTRNTQIKGSI